MSTLRWSHLGAAVAAVGILAACTSRKSAPPAETQTIRPTTTAPSAPNPENALHAQGEPGGHSAAPSSFDPTTGGFILQALIEQKENHQFHKIHVGNADAAARLRCSLPADALHCPADASPCEARSDVITTGTIPPRKTRRINKGILHAELPARIEWVRLSFPLSCSFERTGEADGVAAGSIEIRSDVAGNGQSGAISVEHDGRGRPGTELNCRGTVEKTIESETGETSISVSPFETLRIRDGARGEVTVEAEDGSRLTALRLVLPLQCWYSAAAE